MSPAYRLRRNLFDRTVRQRRAIIFLRPDISRTSVAPESGAGFIIAASAMIGIAVWTALLISLF